MRICFLSRDLLFGSRAQSAAEAGGAVLKTAATGDDALAMLSQEPCGLLVIDLETPRLDLQPLIEAVLRMDSPPRIVAYGSHVKEHLLAAARSAGCDAVLSRGQFDRGMREILRAPEAPHDHA